MSAIVRIAFHVLGRTPLQGFTICGKIDAGIFVAIALLILCHRSKAALPPANPLEKVAATAADGTRCLPTRVAIEQFHKGFHSEMLLQRRENSTNEFDGLATELENYFNGNTQPGIAVSDLISTQGLWRATWNPGKKSLGDGIYELKTVRLKNSACSLNSPPWPKASGDGKLYQAAVFIRTTNLLSILETEKTVPLYQGKDYIGCKGDPQTLVTFYPSEYLVLAQPLGEPAIRFVMRFNSPSQRWPYRPRVDLTVRFRQTLRPTGVLTSQFYSDSPDDSWFAEEDILIPVRKRGEPYGYLVLARVAGELAAWGDSDSQWRAQTRKFLGNWKRFSEARYQATRAVHKRAPDL